MRPWLLVVPVVAILGAAVAAQQRPASQGTAEREILFDSIQQGQQEIWAMRPDASGLRRLTHSPKDSWNTVPDWSPDASKILFASTRHAPTPGFDHMDVYVMNADGSGLQRLTYGPRGNADPDWSPDGKRLAFVSNRDGNWKVYVMNADGSNVKRLTTEQLTPSKREVGPSWSPDGRRIAFASDRDGDDLEIYTLELETSTLRKLTDNNAADGHPAWSPDGQSLAFDSTPEGNDANWEIYVMRPDVSNVVQLTRHPRMDNAPAWSRDGQRIAFNSTRDSSSDDLANCEIYVMNRDGSNVRRLTRNSVKDTHPDW